MRKGSSHGAHEYTQSDAAGNRPAIANLQHAAPSATPLAYAASYYNYQSRRIGGDGVVFRGGGQNTM